MKLITRDTDYAIRAICYIALHPKSVVSVKELVKELKIPKPFLRKILQILNKKGLLKSFKGKDGGFILDNSPDKISIVDLIKIFQGNLELTECMLRKSICPDIRRCKLKKKINRLERELISEMKDITVHSLITKRRRV